MQVHVGSLAGSLFSPSLASAMMAATGPWPVMLVGVACLVVGAIAFMFVPETLQHKGDHLSDDDDDRPEGLKAHVVHTVVQLRESISILRSTSLTLLLITSLATSPAGASLAQFLVQYISKRYEIPIQSTGYVQTAYGLAQVVQALLILPWLSHVLMQDYVPGFLRMENEQRRDLFLTRWSFGLLLLGFLALAVAPTLVIFVFGLVIMALGSASYSLAKSLMSLYVDPEHRSRLFVLVGMVETVGGMYGPPMLAGLFSLGMNLGGAWIGLPYIGISGLIATALGILLFVKVPKQRGESASPDEEARDH